ncbi:hypothetical protein AB0P37_25435, partial [Streptomyces antimycoticus]|uniref:hypothetical protein n=1 Tax=Streptomyces antimycoticus TaxID=68175 RepID=UPI0034437A80
VTLFPVFNALTGAANPQLAKAQSNVDVILRAKKARRPEGPEPGGPEARRAGSSLCGRARPP